MTLLESLREKGIRLIPEGDNLRLRAPASVITPAIRDQIAANKELLRAQLQGEQQARLSYAELVEAIRYSASFDELELLLEQINEHHVQQTLEVSQIESLATQMLYESRRIARKEINVPISLSDTL